MKKLRRSISLICFFVLTSGLAYGQAGQDFAEMREEIVEQQKNTRAEIEHLNRQIQKFEERLQQADQKYEALYNKYNNLKQVIALQDQKIVKLEREQSQVGEEISITAQSIEEKQKELKRLIENYKKTLSYLYKHGRTSQLALIFSSSSVNQMLVRAFYLKKFNSYRERQAEQIRETERQLAQNKNELEKARARNEEVLNEIRTEKKQLAEKEEQQQKNVALLRENRNKIKANLQEIQQQKEELNNTLTELIRREDEIREKREGSESVTNRNFMDAEEMKAVETNFAESKGLLPWPVDSRTISEHFGNRRHPVYGTVTPNLGVEIVTDPQASVRAVHDGYVIDIRPIPGYGDVVVVKHGRFITAYGNLSQIMVRKSEILDQDDMIGLAGDSDSPRGESLFFLIRENNDNLDPEQWLQMETVSDNY